VKYSSSQVELNWASSARQTRLAVAGTSGCGEIPTSDKANHCLGLLHSESNALLQCSLIEYSHDRMPLNNSRFVVVLLKREA
jgi:hypothetical protein